jgi:hypothetical protein
MPKRQHGTLSEVVAYDSHIFIHALTTQTLQQINTKMGGTQATIRHTVRNTLPSQKAANILHTMALASTQVIYIYIHYHTHGQEYAAQPTEGSFYGCSGYIGYMYTSYYSATEHTVKYSLHKHKHAHTQTHTQTQGSLWLPLIVCLSVCVGLCLCLSVSLCEQTNMGHRMQYRSLVLTRITKRV